MIRLQFVIEKGLEQGLGREMQRRVFGRFGMKTTSMMSGQNPCSWKL